MAYASILKIKEIMKKTYHVDINLVKCKITHGKTKINQSIKQLNNYNFYIIFHCRFIDQVLQVIHDGTCTDNFNGVDQTPRTPRDQLFQFYVLF